MGTVVYTTFTVVRINTQYIFLNLWSLMNGLGLAWKWKKGSQRLRDPFLSESSDSLSEFGTVTFLFIS